jgi:hypothetical protein
MTGQVIINIDVDDLEEGIRFYTTAFDLRLAERLFEGTVAELSGGAAPIQLLLKEPGTIAAGTGGAPLHSTLDAGAPGLRGLRYLCCPPTCDRCGGDARRRNTDVSLGTARDVERSVRSRLLPDPIRGTRLPRRRITA